MRRTLAIILSVIFAVSLYAQRDFQILSSDISMTGKSTFHDWNASINNISGTAEMVINDGNLEDIKNLKILIEAHSIKSDKGGLMDKNIYKSLKASEHPEIIFDLIKIHSINKKGKETNIVAIGNLTIAGTTKKIYLQADGKKINEGFKINGSKVINLKTFNIHPPSHLFGTIKADNLVTICFEATFSHSGLCQQNVFLNF